MAVALVARPSWFDAVAWYEPASVGETDSRVRTAFVAAGMVTPPRYHWKEGAGKPEAAMVRLTGEPAETV